jgi:hypothetical protein
MGGAPVNTYERETQEFQPVVVTLDGVPLLSNFEVALVPRGWRPTLWASPATIDDKPGIMIQGLNPGVYEIFVRITDMPEIPVVWAGSVVVR